MSAAVQRVLDALEARDCRVSRSGAGWQCQCPAHEDRTPSLCVSEGDDGRALIHCQATCATAAVLAALGLAEKDLFERRNGSARVIVATYSYADEQGEILFEVVRYESKDFRQRRPDGRGGWIWKLGDTRRVIYRLPRVLAAVAAGERIFVAEGEKDVAALEKAGATATCNPGGAGKWKREYASYLRGAEVVVIADRDTEGRKHARAVAASLGGMAASVALVEAATGKDASDHLAAGLTLEQFEQLPAEVNTPPAAGTLLGDEPATTSRAAGKPASLVTRASDVRSRSVRWAWEGRLALGYLTVQTGIEGLGKSVFAAWMIGQLSRGELPGEWHGRPASVLVLAGEDGIEDTWKPRLDLAGADGDLVSFLDMDSLGDDWNVHDGIGQLHSAITETGAGVVYIDALLDHMPPAKAGESINAPTFVRQALRPLKRTVRELGIVGLFSMHPPKARSANFRDLVQASQAFSAIPRIGLLLAYHPEDPDGMMSRRRVILRGKGNIGRNPSALSFRIEGREYTADDGETTNREYVCDVQPCAVTLADLAPDKVLGKATPTKTERASEIITRALRDGEWHEAPRVRDELGRQGLAGASVIQDGARLAGVKKRKRPGEMNGPWEWRIPLGGVPENAGDSSNLDKSERFFDSSTPRARGVSLEDTFQKTPRIVNDSRRIEESLDGDGPDGRIEESLWRDNTARAMPSTDGSAPDLGCGHTDDAAWRLDAEHPWTCSACHPPARHDIERWAS